MKPEVIPEKILLIYYYDIKVKDEKKADLKKQWNLKIHIKRSSQKSRKMCNIYVDCSRRTTNSQYLYEKILNFTNSQGDKHQNNLHKLKYVLYLLQWRISREVKEKDKGHFNALWAKCKRFQPFLESTLIIFIAFLNIYTVQWAILFQRLHLTEISAPVTQPRITALFLETKTQGAR